MHSTLNRAIILRKVKRERGLREVKYKDEITYKNGPKIGAGSKYFI